MKKTKYTAEMYFSHKGRYHQAFCQTIGFNSINGGKRAFLNAIERVAFGLHFQYGSGQEIIVTARCKGADVDLFTYKYTTY